MTEYQPTSRRPIAGVFRATALAAVRGCVAWGVHPDWISYLSIVAACGGAVGFYFSSRVPALLLVSACLCIVRLWFNMLDGMVALASGKASRRGEIVNELPDRVSDILVFVGIAHSGLANPFLGYWGALLAVMTAYVGTLGQAITGRRRFEGMMSKQYRMAIVALAAVVQFGVGGAKKTPLLSIFDWMLCAVIIGCLQTIVVRLRKMLSEIP